MSSVVPYLAYVACPLSMCLMMWFMARRGHGNVTDHRADDRVAALEREVKTLRDLEQKRDEVSTPLSTR